MKNIVFTVLFLIDIVITCPTINPADINSLIGETVLIPPFSYEGPEFKFNPRDYDNCSFSDFVYSADVLKKEKFKSEFLHKDPNIYATPLYIKDIRVFNKHKKDESIGIIAIRNNEEIIINIPLKFEWSERPLSTLWLTKTWRNKKGITESRGEYVDIPIYNKNKLDSIISLFKSTDFYPVKLFSPSVRKHVDDYYYSSGNHVILGSPYKLCDYKFQKIQGAFNPLVIILEDMGGTRISLPIKPQLIMNESKGISSISLENFSEIFLPEEKLLKEALENNTALVDSVKSLEGREIFLHTNSLPGFYIDKDGSYKKHVDKWYQYFYKVGHPVLIPSNKSKYPFFDVYLLLTNEKFNLTYAYPLTEEALSYFEEPSQKRKEYQSYEENREREFNERILMLEKQLEERKNRLTKKYGKENAELMINGGIKVGFTKEMVLEVESGSIYNGRKIVHELDPNESHWGHTECWTYPDGTTYYFIGNKLNRIQ